MMFRPFVLAAVTVATVLTSAAASADDSLFKFIESRRAADRAAALDLWNWAEVGYQEEQSSARLQKELREAGWYDKTSQAFAVFLTVKSVGVTGDNWVGIRAKRSGSPRRSRIDLPPLAGREVVDADLTDCRAHEP